MRIGIVGVIPMFAIFTLFAGYIGDWLAIILGLFFVFFVPLTISSDSDEERIQREQRMRYEMWVMEEGAVEGPTHRETLREPGQLRRLAWIRDQCEGEDDILEVGCNTGIIIEMVMGKYGLDKNADIIKQNWIRNPNIMWMGWDATDGLPFPDNAVNIVLLPDVLEHMEFEDAKKVVRDAVRVAKKKVLITLPNGYDCSKNFRNWGCFKHLWVPTASKVSELLEGLRWHLHFSYGQAVEGEIGEFLLIEVPVYG